jgi:hypothetical protein
MNKLLQIILAIICFTVAAAAQELRAYTFSYSDGFGSEQNCYLTLRAFDVSWDGASANVIFNCHESAITRQRGIPPKKVFVLPLKGDEFLLEISKTVQAEEVDRPRVLVMSDWLWDLALSTDFIDDFAWDEQEEKLVAQKKSLTDLEAERVDVPLDDLGGPQSK